MSYVRHLAECREPTGFARRRSSSLVVARLRVSLRVFVLRLSAQISARQTDAIGLCIGTSTPDNDF